MKLKFILIALFILSGTSSATKSINKIVINDILGVNFYSSYTVLDGKLFFMERNSNEMWVTDGTKIGTYALKINNNPIELFGFYTSMINYHDSIYFINNSDGNTLWKTDGQSFDKISNKIVNTYPGLVIKNDSIVAYSQDKSELYQINDDGLTVLNLGGLSNPSISSLCLINSSNITLFGKENDSSDYQLFQVIDGQKQVIAQDLLDLHDNFNFSLVNNDSCFYHYSADFSNTNSYFSIDASGVITLVTTEIAGIQVDTWDEIIEFNNNIYFFPIFSNSTKISSNSRSLYQYTNNTITAVNNFELNPKTFHVYASKNFLYAKLHNLNDAIIDPPPPGGTPNYLEIFDETFTFLQRFETSNHESTSQILSYQNNRDLIKPVINNISFIPYIDKLVFVDNTDVVNIINTPNIKVVKTIGDEQNIYLIGFDRKNNNKTSIYSVKNEAVISHNLDGLWYSEDFDSQGLSIHTGARQDGSEYMFVSLYLYKDGNPFWIAGTSELDLTSAVVFNVYDYKGASFLPGDTNQETQKTLFATMVLETLACNKLNMQLEFLDESSISITLDRITNENQMNCVE